MQKVAAQILQARPDTIPVYRVLKDVLRLPAEDKELRRAQAAAEQSKWVKQLEKAQLPDGSWGRFHSQDTKVKTVFRTSEEAIDRAFSLGLGPAHPVLILARRYIEEVLAGKAHISDWDEKNDAWPILIKIILAGKLAEIEPESHAIQPYWEYMAEIARRSFSSGVYRLPDELQAYTQLSLIHQSRSFLQSRFAMALLAAKRLPEKFECTLVEWIWNKPDGMSYLMAPLSSPAPRQMADWLKSMNILYHFPYWKEVGVSVLNQLWEQRDEKGWWDFGQQSSMCRDFPISENWRRNLKRKVDYTTCMLAVLRRYFD